jgi:hypothetical protein
VSVTDRCHVILIINFGGGSPFLLPGSRACACGAPSARTLRVRFFWIEHMRACPTTVPVQAHIYEHDRRRSTCKDCLGSSIYPHKSRKSYCTECVGSQICEHDRIRSTCKDCGGSSICPHKSIKYRCKDCRSARGGGGGGGGEEENNLIILKR